jgi:hypothetical protein
MECPSFELLALYIGDKLDLLVKLELEQHLPKCLSCQEKMLWYKQTSKDLKNSLNKGPDWIVEKAKKLFAQSLYAKPKLPNKIFAQLIFDSFKNSEKLAIRSLQAVPDTSRRLLFRADLAASKEIIHQTDFSFDIDIEIQSSNFSNTFALQGQVLSEKEDFSNYCPLYIDLIKNGSRIKNTITNDFGEFSFLNIVEGDYCIQIKSDLWITVAELPIRLTVF